MKTPQVLLKKGGKDMIPRYIGNLFLFNLTIGFITLQKDFLYNHTHIPLCPFLGAQHVHSLHQWRSRQCLTHKCYSGCLICWQRMQKAVHTHTKETGSHGLDRKAHLGGKIICAQGNTAQWRAMVWRIQECWYRLCDTMLAVLLPEIRASDLT